MTTRTPNEQQTAAIAARGQVFVSAGAGTGKTTVLVERFVEAVCERGIDVESMLVITYTERAAGELKGRIRARLHELGRHDLARSLDGAWISTIHGFCLRLLKSHPFAAGLDPRFRILDDSQGRVIRGEAFEAALNEFCAGEDPDRLQLLATYGAGGLRRMLTTVYETLRSAGRELDLELGERADLKAQLDELAQVARALAADPDATDAARTAAAQAVALAESETLPERLLDLSGLRARGERAASYEDARKAVEQAALDELALQDRELLQQLLHGFAAQYAAAKDRESALDFEDLQLHARDLLRDDESLRERERLRFRSIMVDEFQDTNRLQCELVDLLTGPDTERFFVGDEFQSIYGFRHADVQVFRERRAGAETLLPLTRNYRSRPEVLAVVNHLFGAEFGEEFQPLAASGEFPDPVFGTPVELLVTDKAAYAGTGVHWRRAEAKNVARRVKELVDTGAATAGEIVLLFAAGTDAEWYEEELRSAGLATYRATGRGYFGQQQVVDLLSYLRLLQNRYDDEALVSVLASPFVGVSNDALMLIRRNARGPIFTGLERTLPPDLDPDDTRLLRAFRQRYDRLAEAAPRLSLERLCERIVADHDYDLAVLAQWDGRRRYANLRKLARLARSYEELRGPDVEGFVRFVEEQEAVGAAERDAVAEEEGADAVRLLTIHAAKGLEFKVVVVADAGRDRNAPSADEILCLADGRFGFRVADPATGRRHGVLGYDSVKEARAAEDEAERLRLYYVAMTRAIDRLIVSGSIDPERKADERTPIGWVLGRLDCADELGAAGETPLELEREGARVLVRVDRTPPAPVERAAPGARGCGRRRGDRPAGSLRRRGGAEAAAARSRARADPGAAGAAAARRAPPLLQRARALRALLVPLLRGACRGDAGGAGARHRGRADGTRRDRGRRRRPPPARGRRPRGAGGAGRRPGARVVPGRDATRSCPGSRRSWTTTAAPSWRSGSPRCRAPGPSARSRSSTTACSCTGDSTSSTSRARARSCSTTRRTRSPRGRPTRSSRRTTGCSGSSTHSRASAPVWTRSRSSTTSSSGRTRLSRRRSCVPTCPSSRPSSRRRSAASAPASSCRLRASSTARAVLRSTSSAPGPACSGGPSRPPVLAAAG